MFQPPGPECAQYGRKVGEGGDARQTPPSVPDTGHPGRGVARPPKFLLALPRRQLLTLLQGDEHAARQPALLEESGQLRQELEHKPGPVRQTQILAP